MSRVWRWWVAAVLAAGGPAGAVDLMPIERTWLGAAMPVLRFAREQALPLDIIVQPQPTPGETPMGMAFIDGRCKLVLSMRGNPEAQATLDRIGPDLLEPVIEAIVAHELGHCWRHVRGDWGQLPHTLKDGNDWSRVTSEQAELLQSMWRMRREEAYADLVGLAWTLQRHPDRYAEVHAWHVRLRADPSLETGPHDTVHWVRMASDRSRFTPSGSLFERVLPLWHAGLQVGSLGRSVSAR